MKKQIIKKTKSAILSRKYSEEFSFFDKKGNEYLGTRELYEKDLIHENDFIKFAKINLDFYKGPSEEFFSIFSELKHKKNREEYIESILDKNNKLILTDESISELKLLQNYLFEKIIEYQECSIHERECVLLDIESVCSQKQVSSLLGRRFVDNSEPLNFCQHICNEFIWLANNSEYFKFILICRNKECSKRRFVVNNDSKKTTFCSDMCSSLYNNKKNSSGRYKREKDRMSNGTSKKTYSRFKCKNDADAPINAWKLHQKTISN